MRQFFELDCLQIMMELEGVEQVHTNKIYFITNK